MIRNRSNGERKGERSSAEVLRARRCSADPLRVLDAAFRISEGLKGTSCARGGWVGAPRHSQEQEVLLCSEPHELCSGCLRSHGAGPVVTMCPPGHVSALYWGTTPIPAVAIPSLQCQSQQPNVSSEDLTALQRGTLIPHAPL